jgi:DNA-binding MarR family transcriptional regulator
MKNYNAIQKFKKVAKLWNEFEKKPHDFGNGQVVYHAEVFLLMHINGHKDPSVTDLAKILGISKASVSEVLKKLEKKELIIKKKSPVNASKIIVEASAKGLEVLKLHDKIHSKIESDFKAYYETLTNDQLSFLEEFFSNFEDFLTEINKSKIIETIPSAKNKK